MIEKQLCEELDRWAPEQQLRVLAFARAMAGKSPHGVAGKSLTGFSGTIEPADLVVIAGAIDDACEQVRLDERSERSG
jgi:hypothetical protein